MLAYLALESGSHTRDFLADLLWPAESIATGRENLRRMLFVLKESLGECRFEASRNEVSLARGAGWTLDAAELIEFADTASVEAMAQCIENYRGHFLQGFSLDGSPAFERWMETRRADMQSRFSALAISLIEFLDRSGDATRAVAFARRLALLSPWDENAWQTLIRLLVKCGRIEDARAEFALCRAALNDELGVEPSPQTLALLEHASGSRPAAPAAAAPERRQLTILYCELTIPDEDDPDLLAERLVAPAKQCEQLLHAAGAHVTASSGGGLLGYFGYPASREGDARRAAMAALACRRIRGNGLRVRIGLHSAIVLSNATKASPDIAGLATGLAIRMREAAYPGEAVMSESTRRLVAHACRLEPRGELSDALSGRKLETFALVEAAPGSPRWAGDSPLVGRTRELATLQQAWHPVRKSGNASLVFVTGDVGSGKTRLLREFAASVEQALGVRPLIFDCFPELSDKPFHPFLATLAEALGLTTDGSTAHDALLPRISSLGLAQDAALVAASLFDPGCADDARFRLWAPGKWQTLAISALISLIDQLAAAGAPVFFEDTHWSDLSSRDLFTALAAAAPGRLFVATARPGCRAPWPDDKAVRIELQALGSDDSAALARAATPENPPGAEAVERIVAIGGGIPLFIEEVAREMAAKGGTLPATLHEVFQARVDAAGDALPRLRLAASMGAVIDVEVLAGVDGHPRKDVEATLVMLTKIGLLSQVGNNRFAFRHALLRETAYHSQPRSARMAAHARIAQFMAARGPQAAERDPELLAWHYIQAGEPEHAIHCLGLAGNRAVAHSVYRDAIAHFQAALDLLATLPPGPARDQQEMRLRLSIGIPMLAMHGNGSREAADTFRRTLALAEPMGDDPRLFPVYWGLWLGSSTWEHFETSRTLAEKLVRLARLGQEPNWLSHAHYALGNSLFCLGEFAAATRELEAGVAAYRPEDADLSLGEDALVTNLSFLSWSHWYAGRHEDALAASRRAVSRARELEQPYTLGFALVCAAVLHRLRREVDRVEQAATEASELADRFGLALWQAAGKLILGWAKAARGDSTGIQEILAAVSMLGQVMGGIEAMFLAHLVDACSLVGAAEPGLEAAERGLAVALQRKDWHYLAEFQRTKGEFLASRGTDPTEVDAWLSRAMASAEFYGSPSLVLRAAMSRARHERDRGEAGTAHSALQRALAAFKDGAETGDIEKARAMLDTVNATV